MRVLDVPRSIAKSVEKKPENKPKNIHISFKEPAGAPRKRGLTLKPEPSTKRAKTPDFTNIAPYPRQVSLGAFAGLSTGLSAGRSFCCILPLRDLRGQDKPEPQSRHPKAPPTEKRAALFGINRLKTKTKQV
jgi:hypothetical protein